MDAVVDRFELGRLVDDELARRHLAAIVQPAGDFELVPLVLAELEIRERTLARRVGGPGQHVGQFGDAMAVPAGIGRFGVDRAGKHAQERAEQVFLRLDQHLVVERDGRLTGQRLDQRHDFGRERHGLAVRGPRIDQLQHADHLGVVVLQRHGQEGLRAVAGPAVERARAAEVEARGVIGVGQVDRIAGDRGLSDDIAVVWRAVRLAQRHRRERDRRPGGAAERDAHRVVAHDREAQRAAVLADQIERPAIGVGQLLGADQDRLQQAVVVALCRQRDAELDQPSITELPVSARRMRGHDALPDPRGSGRRDGAETRGLVLPVHPGLTRPASGRHRH